MIVGEALCFSVRQWLQPPSPPSDFDKDPMVQMVLFPPSAFMAFLFGLVPSKKGVRLALFPFVTTRMTSCLVALHLRVLRLPSLPFLRRFPPSQLSPPPSLPVLPGLVSIWWSPTLLFPLLLGALETVLFLRSLRHSRSAHLLHPPGFSTPFFFHAASPCGDCATVHGLFFY